LNLSFFFGYFWQIHTLFFLVLKLDLIFHYSSDVFSTFLFFFSSFFIVIMTVFLLVFFVLGRGVNLGFLVNSNLFQLVKMGVSTFHDQNFLSSFLTHFHFMPLQGFKMCSFKQNPSQRNVLSFYALVKGYKICSFEQHPCTNVQI
jgi:hypothetical protein